MHAHANRRRLVRWLALAATCVSLAVSGAPAREAPRPERPAAAWVVGAGPDALQATRTARTPSSRQSGPRWVRASTATPLRPRARVPATRPLYLVNRSLLR